MKFTLSLATLVCVLPLLAQVHATPVPDNRKNGNGKGNNNKASSNGKGNNAAAAPAATAKAAAAPAASQDSQSSLTLDPKVIATGFENNGQDVAEAGQVASLTSSNNFINFCLTVPNLPITNGQQIVTGSCNPAPMGVIAPQSNMPSSKFIFPINGQTINEYQPFTIKMAINNLETGFFVNPNENYFAAPQQVATNGDIQGHSHVVVDFLDSLTQTTITNPQKFAFFKGLNAAAAGGVLSADVTGGLPAGAYRLASINTAANHQPVLVAVAQHGAMDDMIYFTVVKNGTAAAGNAFSSAAAPAKTSAAAAAAKTTAAAAASKGNQNNQKGGNNNQKGKGNNNNGGRGRRADVFQIRTNEESA